MKVKPSVVDLYTELLNRSRSSAIVYFILFCVAIYYTGGLEGVTSGEVFLGLALLLSGLSRMAMGVLPSLRSKANLRSVRFGYYSLIFVSSGLWGVFVAETVIVKGMNEGALLLFFATAGIAGGSLASLAPVLSVLLIQLVVLCVPPLLILTFGDHVSSAYAIMSWIYFAWLVLQSRVVNKEVIEGLTNNKTINEQNKSLERARDQALQASKMKSQFVANMSHEIRTPLNSILGTADLLSEMVISDQKRQMVNELKSAGESLLTIINDILDFSKIEAGELKISPGKTSLKHLVEEVSGIVKRRWGFKGQVEYFVDYGSGLPAVVMTDPVRLRQVLINLLDNAFKFTANGHVKLYVVPVNEVRDSLVVRFVVEDTGRGILKQNIERLFKPFEQLDGSTTRIYGGTGLGLSICKNLVDLMGGQIHVESTFGVGTKFCFELPMQIVEAEVVSSLVVPEVEKSPNRAKAERATFPELSVLLVEDNAMNQVLMKHFFERLGITYQLAQNGQEALETIKKNHYDVVFMDIQVPVMDGYTATRKVREEVPKDRQPYIVALTANAMKGDEEQCLQAGMDAYLSKPVQLTMVQSALEKYKSTLAGREEVGRLHQ